MSILKANFRLFILSFCVISWQSICLSMQLSADQVNQYAKKIAVRIEEENDSNDRKISGSGTIVYHTSDLYYVLSNRHVLDSTRTGSGNNKCTTVTEDDYNNKPQASRYSIITFDGQTYTGNDVSVFPNADLALIKFTSKIQYPVAAISDSSLLREGKTIHFAGYPGEQNISKREYQFFGSKSIRGFLDPA